jgi:hypothetical protein
MKTIEFFVAFAFLWFITTVMTGAVWLWPLVFTGLCAISYLGDAYDERRKCKQGIAIGRERVHREKQQRGEELLVRSCVALANYVEAGCCELTDEEIAVLISNVN